MKRLNAGNFINTVSNNAMPTTEHNAPSITSII